MYLLTLPSYVMQKTLLPKAECDDIDKVCRHFVWGTLKMVGRFILLLRSLYALPSLKVD